MPPKKLGLKRRSLGQEVTRHLRRMIIDGEFRPDERLVEEKIAGRLGISRTPLREAMHRLEQEGLLRKRKQGGYVIAPLSREEVEEVVEVRSALEELVTRLATRRATPETLAPLEDNARRFAEALEAGDEERLVELNTQFHVLLREAAGSRLLTRTLAELDGVVERISRAAISNISAGLWSTTDHRDILEAIKSGNEDLATSMTRKHAIRGGEWILSRMESEEIEL